MRPIFTVHAGEFLVGQYIESRFKGTNVWVPTKDRGFDLLITNGTHKKTLSLQVKFSRDFLPTMKLEPSALKELRSCTWFTLERKKVVTSAADLWVFVLLGFEKSTYDYVMIPPAELLQRLENLHGNTPRYQTYIWVTKKNRAWLTRAISKDDQLKIAENTFRHKVRELTRELNNWTLVEQLQQTRSRRSSSESRSDAQ
jgi:hypothetical protein